MKRLFNYISIIALTSACIGLKPDDVEIVQLGIVEDAVVAGAYHGECGVKVLADRDYALAFEGKPSWVRVDRATRDTIVFSLDANEGFRRCAYLDISADGRKDRVQVRQEGLWMESVSLSQTSLNVSAEGCHGSIRVISNLPSDYMKAVYKDTKALSNVRLEDYILEFTVLPSHNRDPRTLEIDIEYVNGWDEVVSQSLTIYQEAYE